MQLNPQVSVDTGGNRDLQPETSETLTAGFTWQIPLSGSFERLLVEANYYDIDIEGAIQAPDAQDTLDACIATLDPLFCNQVNRTPSGTITSIEGTLNNIGGIETSGVDVNLDLSLGESGAGSFRFQLMASFLMDYDELFANSAGGFDRVDRAGQELGSPTRGFVEEKATLNTFWELGDFSAVLSLRYLSSLTEQCVGLVADFGQTDFLLRSRRPDEQARQPAVHRCAVRLGAGRTVRRRLELRGRRAEPDGRRAADLLLLRPQQPRRYALSDRWPVLVPAGVVPELTALPPLGEEKPPQGGFSLARCSCIRRPEGLRRHRRRRAGHAAWRRGRAQPAADRPGGGHVRLGEVADVRLEDDPVAIEREAVSRYVDVEAGVEGRSLGAVAGDVRDRVAELSSRSSTTPRCSRRARPMS